LKVKNFAIWLKYDSRSGTHNVSLSFSAPLFTCLFAPALTPQMVKEFRALSRAEAVEQMYQDLAARHRARFRSVQIIRVAEVEKKDDIRRPYIKQLLEPGLKFPLPHRRTTSKGWYAASRPATWA
jgi:large subunit ribosomal protein L18Ae